MGRRRRLFRYAALALAAALPALLVVSAVRTYQALDAMREVFLRHRAAMMAYQLELSPAGPEGLDQLRSSEPDLVDVETFSGPIQGPEGASVNALFRGETLYLASETTISGRRVYRVYLPVHHPVLTVARLDVSAASANFLVRDSQRNLALAFVAAAGAVLVLGGYLLATRRRLERERLAELGEMSAVLAHEIRNPLGTIKGFVQLAEEKSEASLRSLLEPVLLEVDRLEKLVRDLLLFARPPARLSPESVSWEEMSRRLSAVAEDSGQGRAITFHVEPAPGLELKTDRNALFQILANLVRNAAEALVEGGEIRVRTRRTHHDVTIQVEDDGPGLSEAARGKIFQPFFTTKSDGTGLGLAISQRLARQLGGELKVEPAEPQGVRAVLTLRGQ